MTSVKINDIKFQPKDLAPITIASRHSTGSLAGLDMSFVARGMTEIELIQKLLDQPTVQVEDPFVHRTYEAKFSVRMTQFQEGQPERYYETEIREVDKTPEVKTLILDGLELAVINYSEPDGLNNEIIRRALLKLSGEQFQAVWEAIRRHDTVQIKRLGVDDEAITYRVGRDTYWSLHDIEGERYYKQVISLLPPDKSGPRFNIAPRNEVDNLIKMVSALTVRFEQLMKVLVQGNTISSEQAQSLLGMDWENLAEATRIDQLHLELKRVDDAATEIW